MTDWRSYARALVDRLVDAGELSDPAWIAAFLAVPRHRFVPDRDLSTAYHDDALVTQVRPALTPTGDTLDLPTSSASAPSVVAIMLDRLDVRDGVRVLEIGTGTGYNAALLAHRLGDRSVSSVDIDPELVASAGRSLRELGYRPNLASGDGAAGLPGTAPYDRIIATCAVTHIPPAWIDQLTPGGRIVAPLLGEGGALLVLDKTADDEVTGRFDPCVVAFMPLRRELASPLAAGTRIGFHRPGVAHYGTTGLDPRTLTDPDPDLRLFLQLHLSGCAIGTVDGPAGTATILAADDGVAEVPHRPGEDGTWSTVQRGCRPWDTAEHALRAWATLGAPDRGRYGISALNDADRQYVWLDDPDGRYAWPLLAPSRLRAGGTTPTRSGPAS